MPKRPKIFIYIHYLEIGGAERALIGLLNALDPAKVDIDLFVNQHTGEFMPLVPEYVNLITQLPEYAAIERPIRQIVSEGHYGIAVRRLIAKYRHHRHLKKANLPAGTVDNSLFQYVFRQVTPALRDLSCLGYYDLAISFLHPHNIVLDKVKARRKVCWIHTDYSTVYVNDEIELPVWAAYDYIAAISDDAAKAFAERFPQTASRIFTMENILSSKVIRSEASRASVSLDMPRRESQLNLLSIGRYCAAKRFDEIPHICRLLLDKGLRFKWYIIGFGDDKQIRANIAKYKVADTVVLLGKKSNPYPYVAASDLYVQPSLYEGKSVTVREAQILCRPVVISAYPTASSQVVDGVDGVIVPLDIEACADGIYDLAVDIEKRELITQYLATHDYGNEREAQKIYALLGMGQPCPLWRRQ